VSWRNPHCGSDDREHPRNHQEMPADQNQSGIADVGLRIGNQRDLTFYYRPSVIINLSCLLLGAVFFRYLIEFNIRVLDRGSLGPSTVTLMALLYVVTCGGLLATVILNVKLLPAKNIVVQRRLTLCTQPQKYVKMLKVKQPTIRHSID